MRVSLWYNLLSADRTVAPSTLFSTGTDRGTLYQGRVDYTFTKNIAAYFLAEYFRPGDFYVSTADDALFLRTELQLKY
jgi:hypothetical protein